ncbi:hypothetical protein RCL1_001904 [Eukaryota sp. TZLM3-RCL]
MQLDTLSCVDDFVSFIESRSIEELGTVLASFSASKLDVIFSQLLALLSPSTATPLPDHKLLLPSFTTFFTAFSSLNLPVTPSFNDLMTAVSSLPSDHNISHPLPSPPLSNVSSDPPVIHRSPSCPPLSIITDNLNDEPSPNPQSSLGFTHSTYPRPTQTPAKSSLSAHSRNLLHLKSLYLEREEAMERGKKMREEMDEKQRKRRQQVFEMVKRARERRKEKDQKVDKYRENFEVKIEKNVPKIKNKVKNFNISEKVKCDLAQIQSNLIAKSKAKEKEEINQRLRLDKLKENARKLLNKIKEGQTINYNQVQSIKMINSENIAQNGVTHKVSPRILHQKQSNLKISPKIFVMDEKLLHVASEFSSLLQENGWKSSTNISTQIFDLKFLIKSSTLHSDSHRFTPNQIINHFARCQTLTTKFQIIKTLKDAFWTGISSDLFFPMCFDLNFIDDVIAFISNYFIFKAISVLKFWSKILVDPVPLSVKFSFIVCSCFLSHLEVNQNLLTTPLQCISMENWKEILGQNFDLLGFFESKFRKNLSEVKSLFNFNQNFEPKIPNFDLNDVMSLLNSIKINLPQFDLIGNHSLWILKPGALSRGRNISVIQNLNQVFTSNFSSNFVVQKYLENPFLINNRKFDIRQWVVVTNFPKFSVHFFHKFYVRLCSSEYDDCEISDRYKHLTNYCVQKEILAENLDQEVEESSITNEDLIWSVDKFSQYFIENFYQTDVVEKLQDQFKEIAISTINCVAEEFSCKYKVVETFGFDFIVDSNLKVWLLEVNSSPTMARDTATTDSMVGELMYATGELVLKRKSKHLPCIYSTPSVEFSGHLINSDSFIVEGSRISL